MDGCKDLSGLKYQIPPKRYDFLNIMMLYVTDAEVLATARLIASRCLFITRHHLLHPSSHLLPCCCCCHYCHSCCCCPAAIGVSVAVSFWQSQKRARVETLRSRMSGGLQANLIEYLWADWGAARARVRPVGGLCWQSHVLTRLQSAWH